MPPKRSNHCFAPGCTSGQYRSTSKVKVSLFRVPSNAEMFEKWKNVIPRDGLKPHSALCELHFEDHFIIRAYVHRVGNDTVTIPRTLPTLAPDAIPTRFPNTPNYVPITLPEKQEASQPNEQNKPLKIDHVYSLQTTFPQTQENKQSDEQNQPLEVYKDHSYVTPLLDIDEDHSYVPPLLDIDEDHSYVTPLLDIDEDHTYVPPLLDIEESSGLPFDFCNLKLPTLLWGKIVPVNSPTQVAYTVARVTITPNEQQISTDKMVIFSDESGCISAKIFIRGQLLDSLPDLKDKSEAEDLLSYANDLKLCPGAGNPRYFPFVKTTPSSMTLHGGTFFHAKCIVVTEKAGRCVFCKYARKYLHCITSRARIPKKSPAKRDGKKETQIKLLKKKVRNLTKEILKKNQMDEEVALNNAIQSLPQKQQMAVMQCFDAAMMKDKHNRRYENEWILESILMWKRSPKLYRHIREQQILVLPSQSTIQRHLQNYTFGFGLDINTSMFGFDVNTG